MNCRKGDLAVVIRSACGNEGRIVRCLEYVGSSVHVRATNGDMLYFKGDVWQIDQAINTRNTATGRVRQTYHCKDVLLRPLRGDVTDEDVTETFSITEAQPA